MESNKDEALKCLSIAQRYRDAGNLMSARKFCSKSINLFRTPEAEILLKSIETLEESASSEPSSSAEAKTSSAEAHPSSSGAKHRHPKHTSASSSSTSLPNGTASGSGGEKREYTAEQAAVVKRVRSCEVTEYYEILSVSKTCEEAEVKKAYRKVRSIILFLTRG